MCRLSLGPLSCSILCSRRREILQFSSPWPGRAHVFWLPATANPSSTPHWFRILNLRMDIASQERSPYSPEPCMVRKQLHHQLQLFPHQLTIFQSPIRMLLRIRPMARNENSSFWADPDDNTMVRSLLPHFSISGAGLAQECARAGAHLYICPARSLLSCTSRCTVSTRICSACISPKAVSKDGMIGGA